MCYDSCTLRGICMEVEHGGNMVEHGPLDEHLPLQTGGFPLPRLVEGV